MSIINDLFNRVSRTSNVKSGVTKYTPYTSLFNRNHNNVSYNVGRSILRDTQVSTGFEILKYLLSSKQWILTDPNEDDSTIYDFINEMLKGMDTELNTVVKQMCSAVMWGFNVHEIIYDVLDGRLICKDLVPIHIKTLQPTFCL